MILAAKKEHSLAPLARPSALRVLAVASLFILGSPAVAAPDLADPRAKPVIVGKPADAKTGTIQLAAKRNAKSLRHAKPKRQAKPGRQAKPRTQATSKSRSRATAKTTRKPVPKPAPGRTAAVPLPSARPISTAAAPIAIPPATPPIHAPNVHTIPPAQTIITTAAIDVAAVKRAIEMSRRNKQSDATEVKKSIADPVARKLVEWVILRGDDLSADFGRYAAFIAANPTWPSIVTLRRKAEAVAWHDRPDAAKVRVFFGQWPPLSAKGRLAHARALVAGGDRKRAEALVRETWRKDSLSRDLERMVDDIFGDFLTRADHKARMNRRLYEKSDTDAGMRAAQRLGGHEPAIAKARIAMLKRGSKSALNAVPKAARDDIGYQFAHLQMLRRGNQLSDAAALLRTVPRLDSSHDADEWWVERRVLARSLLDAGKPKDAYLVVRDATPPERDNYRAEHQFLSGWIALRFLHDPVTAYNHFKHVADGIDNPIARSRGSYWMGRAAEAMHRPQVARAHYQDAARYPTAYYGQIARAKAGLGEMTLRPLPALSREQRERATHAEVVRAAELLYAADARDLAWTMMADLGDKLDDVATMVVLAELTAKYRDARGMLLLGRLALGRGYALDHAAFPTMGVPDYKPIGPPVDPAIVYSIVRQESWFNTRTVSSASALGLMQVTPPTGRYVAKKYKVPFDKKRLLEDMVYNVQIGAAELGDVIGDYRGSYILAFVAYNAGRGRVKEWVSRFGDPRSPKVDPIDWVERIPFSETRNYVQRVMENVQVYRVRFGGGNRLLIEADLRRGSTAN
jgi:soluble lytic murein transglycosylase